MAEQGPGGGYGPNWGPAPPAPPPANKTNPGVWLAVGCAAVFVIALGAFAALGFVAWSAAKSGKTVGGAFSAGVKVELDGGALAFDAGAKTGPPPGAGGPTCEKAAECCKAVFKGGGANAASLAACEGLATGTEAECQQALNAYRLSAPAFGAACP
jgi:hypothetical protein